MEMAKKWAPMLYLDPKQMNVIEEVKRLTGGGADVAIEALGIQQTFENCLRCLRPEER
jgi:threonine dehydrogenase-like Zn-dependent dehydrogenase